jgi:hypothetical protein
MNATQLTLVGYLASGKPVELVKPKGCVVTCNGNRSYLLTLESLVSKGVAERVPGTTSQWRLTELGRKWFLPDLKGKSDD